MNGWQSTEENNKTRIKSYLLCAYVTASIGAHVPSISGNVWHRSYDSHRPSSCATCLHRHDIKLSELSSTFRAFGVRRLKFKANPKCK